MFRRLPPSLPKDYRYPENLKDLGYFVNDVDEIREIKAPENYFTFKISRDDRITQMRRLAFDAAATTVVHERLEAAGLIKVHLPLAAEEGKPRLPIFFSKNLDQRSHIILLAYESTQDLGIFAHRIVSGRGGVNKGSAVDFVKAVQAIKCPDGSQPGIILGNMGELRWWRKGKRAVTQSKWYALPQQSTVEQPFRFDETKNTIPGNRDTKEHFATLFGQVIKQQTNVSAKVFLIAVSEGCEQAIRFFNQPVYFDKWKGRLSSIVMMNPQHTTEELLGQFKGWLRKRGRAYVVSHKEKDALVLAPEGNNVHKGYGAAAYSLGQAYYSELLLPLGYEEVLDWIKATFDDHYEAPEVVGEDEKEVEMGWHGD